MSRSYLMWAVATLAAIAGLVTLGLRIAPTQQASNSAESRQSCKVESPDELKAVSKYWCAIGLFKSVHVTIEKENVITVLQFSQNGMQAWQMQSAGLIGEFRTNTDRMASVAKGKNVSVDVHDAADKRVAACARLSTDAAAKCEER
jgi:hypothetical protein